MVCSLGQQRIGHFRLFQRVYQAQNTSNSDCRRTSEVQIVQLDSPSLADVGRY
jgi:hypothetical protein